MEFYGDLLLLPEDTTLDMDMDMDMACCTCSSGQHPV